ncbi:MAG TPA: nucleotidyltransferase domain-containing protein [Candidatus Deferrimicrobium sp.]|nr:nucleotidyltransferase domain-containing protein [Candidatus Kapabacteria bacterium]HLP58537.1 nucleotidyltransferase domain-containing protein [Candidatus Deferrimicrobium sp.]
MDKKSVLNIIDRFKNILEQKVKITKIILFGSYARGNYNDNSDIDLIVISNDFAAMNYWERIDFLSGAIYEIFEPIEALLFTPSEWEKNTSLLNDYACDGETVYAA